MLEMGLPQKIVNLVRMCARDWVNIVQGEYSNDFKIRKEVRQEDVLSPYFIYKRFLSNDVYCYYSENILKVKIT